MAKIKITTSCTGERFSYSKGDVIDADPKVAKALIKAKYATAVKGKATAETTAEVETKA